MSNPSPSPEIIVDASELKVGRRGPDKLLQSFSRTRFPLWLVLSLLVHVGLALFISYGYLRDHYLDPEGAAARKAAALAAEAAAEKPTPPVAGAKSTTTNRTDALLDQRKDTPVVKRITEEAKPAEIPKQPADLGLSVDDTNTK